MEVSEARRLKALQDENAKLKRLLAESVMDVSTLKELLEKKPRDARFAAGSRDLGDYETGLLAAAGQRACRLIGMDPNT